MCSNCTSLASQHHFLLQNLSFAAQFGTDNLDTMAKALPIKFGKEPLFGAKASSTEDLPRSMELEQLVQSSMHTRAVLSRLAADLKAQCRIETEAPKVPTKSAGESADAENRPPEKRSPEPKLGASALRSAGGKRVSPFTRSQRAMKVAGEAAQELVRLTENVDDEEKLMTPLAAITESELGWGSLSREQLLNGARALQKTAHYSENVLKMDAQRELVLREVRGCIDLCEETRDAYMDWQTAKLDEMAAERAIKRIDGRKNPEDMAAERQNKVQADDRSKHAEQRIKRGAALVTVQQRDLAYKCAMEYMRAVMLTIGSVRSILDEPLREPLKAHSKDLLSREQRRLHEAWKAPAERVEPEEHNVAEVA